MMMMRNSDETKRTSRRPWREILKCKKIIKKITECRRILLKLLRTCPVDAGLLEEVGEDATQETLRDERLWIVLPFATEAFIPASFMFPTI